MRNYLNSFDESALVLGKSEYSGSSHHTITIFSNEIEHGIGISTDFGSIKPSILLDKSRLNIILGFGQSVYFIHIPRNQIIARFTIDSIFYQFLTFFNIGTSDFFWAVHEIGIVAYSFDGKEKWQHSFNDIITKLDVEQNTVLLRLMESPNDQIVVDIESGKPTIKNNS